jgi:hypothetical protein
MGLFTARAEYMPPLSVRVARHVRLVRMARPGHPSTCSRRQFVSKTKQARGIFSRECKFPLIQNSRPIQERLQLRLRERSSVGEISLTAFEMKIGTGAVDRVSARKIFHIAFGVRLKI